MVQPHGAHHQETRDERPTPSAGDGARGADDSPGVAGPGPGLPVGPRPRHRVLPGDARVPPLKQKLQNKKRKKTEQLKVEPRNGRRFVANYLKQS